MSDERPGMKAAGWIVLAFLAELLFLGIVLALGVLLFCAAGCATQPVTQTTAETNAAAPVVVTNAPVVGLPPLPVRQAAVARTALTAQVFAVQPPAVGNGVVTVGMGCDSGSATDAGGFVWYAGTAPGQYTIRVQGAPYSIFESNYIWFTNWPAQSPFYGTVAFWELNSNNVPTCVSNARQNFCVTNAVFESPMAKEVCWSCSNTWPWITRGTNGLTYHAWGIAGWHYEVLAGDAPTLRDAAARAELDPLATVDGTNGPWSVALPVAATEGCFMYRSYPTAGN